MVWNIATPLAFVRCAPRRKFVPGLFATAPEYTPFASQCQISTVAFWIGLQFTTFSTVSSRRSGIPFLPSVTLRRSLSPAT